MQLSSMPQPGRSVNSSLLRPAAATWTPRLGSCRRARCSRRSSGAALQGSLERFDAERLEHTNAAAPHNPKIEHLCESVMCDTNLNQAAMYSFSHQ